MGEEPLNDVLAEASAPLQALGLLGLDQRLDGEPTVAELTGRRQRMRDAGFDTLALIEDDGVLHWASGVASPGGSRRGRAGRRPTIHRQMKLELLEPSQLGDYLDRLDRLFLPVEQRGLRRYSPRTGRLGRAGVRPAPRGRVLVLIHGTFSSGTQLIRQLRSTEAGQAWLASACERWDDVLVFDHPTLSVTPWLNAVDLAGAFARSEADIDVVCHSRGGLVTRWWLEHLERIPSRRRRAVLIGCPLAGTSLASPPRLRRSLDLLANLAKLVAGGATLAVPAAPLLAAAAGLMRVLASIVSAGAKVPLADAVVALIPGLAAQSRTVNNPELHRLRAGSRDGLPAYAAVTSDFEPPEVGWQFWRRLVRPAEPLADLAADTVFTEANDLVVDTASMADLADGLRVEHALRFGPGQHVHHLDYLSRPEVLAYVEQQLCGRSPEEG
jgi:hypothetical protein